MPVFSSRSFGALKPVLDRLGSARLLFWLLPLVLAACVIGGTLPQGTGMEGLAIKLGPTAVKVMITLGFNSVFSQWWFILLLILLGLNLTACSLRCWGRLSAGVWTAHLGMLLILLGGVVTGLLGQRASLRLIEGESGRRAMGAREVMELPFAVRLEDFRIEYYSEESHELILVSGQGQTAVELEPGAADVTSLGPKLKVRLLEAYPRFVMTKEGPGNRADGPENPAVRVEIVSEGKTRTLLLFEQFPLFYRTHAGIRELPDLYYRRVPGRVRQFISRLSFLEGGSVAGTAEIYVNRPASWKGYRFYQSGYDPDRGDVSIIQVARDPGVPVVYAGFAVLSLGMLFSLFKRGQG